MNSVVLSILGAIVLLLIFFAGSAIRVVQQYERGVIFVLGCLTGAKGPGLFLVPPFISRMIKVDLRIVTLIVPPQEVITSHLCHTKRHVQDRRKKKIPIIRQVYFEPPLIAPPKGTPSRIPCLKGQGFYEAS